MSEQIAAELGIDEPDGEGLLCPECGRRFKNANGLGVHMSKEHGIAGAARKDRPKRERSTVGGNKGAELNRLRRELKKDVTTVTLLPFMLKGTAANLTNPAVTQVIDEKAEGFADAWVAVAEQNDFVRQNLTRLMSGGIWLHAAAQTAALGYVVAVFSGFAPMHPGALMLLPEMQQFTFQQAPPAGANGGGPAEEHGGDQVA